MPPRGSLWPMTLFWVLSLLRMLSRSMAFQASSLFRPVYRRTPPALCSLWRSCLFGWWHLFLSVILPLTGFLVPHLTHQNNSSGI